MSCFLLATPKDQFAASKAAMRLAHQAEVAKELADGGSPELAKLGLVRLADQPISQHTLALMHPQAHNLQWREDGSKVNRQANGTTARTGRLASTCLQWLLVGLLGHAAQALRHVAQFTHVELVVELDCNRCRAGVGGA